jgi:hypothetical protein
MTHESRRLNLTSPELLRLAVAPVFDSNCASGQSSDLNWRENSVPF